MFLPVDVTVLKMSLLYWHKRVNIQKISITAYLVYLLCLLVKKEKKQRLVGRNKKVLYILNNKTLRFQVNNCFYY